MLVYHRVYLRVCTMLGIPWVYLRVCNMLGIPKGVPWWVSLGIPKGAPWWVSQGEKDC